LSDTCRAKRQKQNGKLLNKTGCDGTCVSFGSAYCRLIATFPSYPTFHGFTAFALVKCNGHNASSRRTLSGLASASGVQVQGLQYTELAFVGEQQNGNIAGKSRKDNNAIKQRVFWWVKHG